jgi:hypothetical protein
MRLRLLALIIAAGTLSVGPATSTLASTAGPSSGTSSERAVATEGLVVVNRPGTPPVTTYGRYWS